MAVHPWEPAPLDWEWCRISPWVPKEAEPQQGTLWANLDHGDFNNWVVHSWAFADCAIFFKLVFNCQIYLGGDTRQVSQLQSAKSIQDNFLVTTLLLSESICELFDFQEQRSNWSVLCRFIPNLRLFFCDFHPLSNYKLHPHTFKQTKNIPIVGKWCNQPVLSV